MALGPVTLRTCLALMLAVILAFAGVNGEAGVDAQPIHSTGLNDDTLHTSLHASMTPADRDAPDQGEHCDYGAPCCPGQHHSCAALSSTHHFERRSAQPGAEFVSTPPLERPQHPPFRPPIG